MSDISPEASTVLREGLSSLVIIGNNWGRGKGETEAEIPTWADLSRDWEPGNGRSGWEEHIQATTTDFSILEVFILAQGLLPPLNLLHNNLFHGDT